MLVNNELALPPLSLTPDTASSMPGSPVLRKSALGPSPLAQVQHKKASSQFPPIPHSLENLDHLENLLGTVRTALGKHLTQFSWPFDLSSLTNLCLISHPTCNYELIFLTSRYFILISYSCLLPLLRQCNDSPVMTIHFMMMFSSLQNWFALWFICCSFHYSLTSYNIFLAFLKFVNWFVCELLVLKVI